MIRSPDSSPCPRGDSSPKGWRPPALSCSRPGTPPGSGHQPPCAGRTDPARPTRAPDFLHARAMRLLTWNLAFQTAKRDRLASARCGCHRTGCRSSAHQHHRMRATCDGDRMLGLDQFRARRVEGIVGDPPEVDRAAFSTVIEVVEGEHGKRPARSVECRGFRQDAVHRKVADPGQRAALRVEPQ